MSVSVSTRNAFAWIGNKIPTETWEHDSSRAQNRGKAAARP